MRWPKARATLLFDKESNVRQTGGMIVNVRTFLRDFSAIKTRARKGETVRVKDKAGEFLFLADVPRKSLIGAAAGKMVFHGDLTKPTLTNAAWKPSL